MHSTNGVYSYTRYRCLLFTCFTKFNATNKLTIFVAVLCVILQSFINPSIRKRASDASSLIHASYVLSYGPVYSQLYPVYPDFFPDNSASLL